MIMKHEITITQAQLDGFHYAADKHAVQLFTEAETEDVTLEDGTTAKRVTKEAEPRDETTEERDTRRAEWLMAEIGPKFDEWARNHQAEIEQKYFEMAKQLDDSDKDAVKALIAARMAARANQ